MLSYAMLAKVLVMLFAEVSTVFLVMIKAPHRARWLARSRHTQSSLPVRLLVGDIIYILRLLLITSLIVHFHSVNIFQIINIE
jgi:hypothetical protein